MNWCYDCHNQLA